MSTKSNIKVSPATPRTTKTRVVAKSDPDSASPLQNVRSSVDKSPRPVAAKKPVAGRSPNISTPTQKNIPRIVKPSDLQSQLDEALESLNEAKEKLISIEKEKEKALEDLRQSQRLADEANEKLAEALVAQKRAEEDSEIEKFRTVEMEANIEAAQKKEEDWAKELEIVRNQHAADVAALLTATHELEKMSQELAMTCDAKNQALRHAEEATKIAESNLEKVEALSAELANVKSMLERQADMVENESKKYEAELRMEVDSLKKELEKAKQLELELAEKSEREVESLRKELEKAKQLELELAEKSELEVESLRKELEKAKQLELELAEKLELEVESSRKELEHAKKLELELAEKLELEVASSRKELEKAKKLELKLAEKDAALEQLNVDLEAARMAETYARNLIDELHEKSEELASQAEHAKRLEISASESLESVMKQLERSNDLLHAAESENAALKEEVGLLGIASKRHKNDLEGVERRVELAKQEASEMSKKVESLTAELEAVKEEKLISLNNEKLAAASVQTLLEEKNKLIDDLESSRDEEEKTKKALEGLASALHEVSAEARDAKEKLLSIQVEHENYESQIEDLKLVLKATNEKYENLLDDAKKETHALANSIEGTRHDHQKLKAEWEKKELHLVDVLKKSDEDKCSMDNEIKRLVNLLKNAEEEACATREEACHWKNSLKEAESEIVYLKEILGEAKAESMRYKECLLDKDNELQNILQENDELRRKENDSEEKVQELSKLLEDALVKLHGKENGELTESEKDDDVLPKVVEFSEQNGAVGMISKEETLPQERELHAEGNEMSPDLKKYNDGVLKVSEEDGTNGKIKDHENERLDSDSAEGDHKAWENCKTPENHKLPEGDAGHESVEDELDSKAGDADGYDQVNELSSKDGNDNGSPLEQQSSGQKKKNALFRKFGSMLKKKSPSNHK